MNELYKTLEDIRIGGQHAFLIVGNIKTILPILKDGIEKVFGRRIDNNPDYYEFVIEKFNIAGARDLRTAGQKTSLGGSNRFFVIGADSFLEEAQSALLKTLEEPIPGHLFFIITPNDHLLLSTVKSRLQKLNFFPENVLGDVLSDKFLNSSLQDRLLMIPEILDENAEPSTQRIAVKNLIVNLKKKVFDEYKGRDFYDKNNFEQVMSEISKAEKYSGDISSAPRLLLEFLSFICPRSNKT
ncbi:MAG: hypothetical protein UT05_C0007G0031 [Parcubacteria group bacterium GW2011_GWF2_38_76]|nr:MAG: hypothetical protein UT05_C0007G0031 [Parcubacteria group bacterium GW2011_GWF2_38_76]